MPINIYKSESFEKVDWICDEMWDLPGQLHGLEQWLDKKGTSLAKGQYVADIGFDIRSEATGGGGTLSAAAMKILGEIGMDVYFSEYPSNEPEASGELSV